MMTTASTTLGALGTWLLSACSAAPAPTTAPLPPPRHAVTARPVPSAREAPVRSCREENELFDAVRALRSVDAESPIGAVVVEGLGSPLSDGPAHPPTHSLSGLPALVVGVAEANGRTVQRVVGADGSLGWMAARAELAPAGVVIAGAAPYVGSSLDEDAEGFVATPVRGPAAVIGASDHPHPDQVSELGSGNYLHSAATAWLRVRADGVEGWLRPSLTRVVWRAGAAQDCQQAAPLRGVVRGPFLAMAQKELLRAAPAAGQKLYVLAGSELEVRTWPADTRCTQASSAFYPTAGQGPALVTYECDDPEHRSVLVQRFSDGSAAAHLVTSGARLRPIRVESADVGGTAEPEWIVEVGSKTSHAYDTGLLVLPRDSAAKPGYVQFGGEVATWKVDATSRAIAVVVAGEQDANLSVRTLRLEQEQLKSLPAYLLAERSATNLTEARREAFASAGSMLVPLVYGKRWGQGRVFANLDAACSRGRELPGSRVVADGSAWPQARACPKAR